MDGCMDAEQSLVNDVQKGVGDQKGTEPSEKW
jgi:hypothetical protein